MMTKYSLAVLFLCSSALAQVAPLPPSSNIGSIDRETLYQQGQLVSVKISPNNPIRIFVVGKEEAQVDPSKLTVTVTRLSPGPKKILTTKKEGDYFTIVEHIDTAHPTDLELTTKAKGKTETFKFRIKHRLP